MPNLTSAQLTTFKAAILADANLITARAAGDHGAIAAYYNTNGTGNVWRPSINDAELNTAIVWSEFATLSVALQNTYITLLSSVPIDATSANIRGGFTAVFGPATVSRANLTALAQRVPTKFEALFAVLSVTPVFGYIVAVTDVLSALGS